MRHPWFVAGTWFMESPPMFIENYPWDSSRLFQRNGARDMSLPEGWLLGGSV